LQWFPPPSFNLRSSCGNSFSVVGCFQFRHRPGFFSGPALKAAWCRHLARVRRSIWLSVRRQPAHRTTAPKCHTPSPCRLPVLRRPASGFAPWQATAQTSRSRGWRRHCLAFWPRPATVEPSSSGAQQTFRQANGLEHPVQHAAEFLGLFWRPNRPLPNMLFKGTPTRYAVCLPLTPALGSSKYNSCQSKTASALELLSPQRQSPGYSQL
jgi:hypothetical protein